MKRLLFTTLFALPALGTGAHAQLSQEDMSDKEIYEFLSGNTIGAHDWGQAESLEYHSPTGDAIWREGDMVQIGYYRVKDGDVCYTYEGEDLNNWFCWDFKRDRRTGEVFQWSEFDQFYRLYIAAESDTVSLPQ